MRWPDSARSLALIGRLSAASSNPYADTMKIRLGEFGTLVLPSLSLSILSRRIRTAGKHFHLWKEEEKVVYLYLYAFIYIILMLDWIRRVRHQDPSC